MDSKTYEQCIYDMTHAYPKASLFLFLTLPYTLSALGSQESDPSQWSSLAQFSSGVGTLILWTFWHNVQITPEDFGIDTSKKAGAGDTDTNPRSRLNPATTQA